MNLEPVRTTEKEGWNDSLEQKLQYLSERSIQLQEYSRFLKERSREINRRIQACINSKHAA